MHCIALHSITFHYIPFHYIPLHSITLHYIHAFERTERDFQFCAWKWGSSPAGASEGGALWAVLHVRTGAGEATSESVTVIFTRPLVHVGLGNSWRSYMEFEKKSRDIMRHHETPISAIDCEMFFAPYLGWSETTDCHWHVWGVPTCAHPWLRSLIKLTQRDNKDWMLFAWK